MARPCGHRWPGHSCTRLTPHTLHWCTCGETTPVALDDTYRRTPGARGFYIDSLRIAWASLTPRQRRRLWKLDPVIAISLRHLIEDNLLEAPVSTPDL